MWRTVIIVGCCVGAGFSTPVGVKDIPMVDDQLFNKKTEMAMSTLNLPSNATSIRADITDGFSCDGRLYGYYADIDNDCQIFHVCLPVTYPDGKENTFRWSFICPEETVFSQESFTCVRSLDMGFDCAESVRFYDLNRNFGMASDIEGEMLRVPSDETKKEKIESKPIVSITTTTAPVTAAKRRPGDYSVRRQPTKAAATTVAQTIPVVRAKPTRFVAKTPSKPVEIKPILNKNEFLKNHVNNGLRRTPLRPVAVTKDEIKPIVEIVDEQTPVVEEEIKKIVVNAAESTPVEVKPDIVKTDPVEVQPIKNLEVPMVENMDQKSEIPAEKASEEVSIESANEPTKLFTPADNIVMTQDNTNVALEPIAHEHVEHEKMEEIPPMTHSAASATESETLKSPVDAEKQSQPSDVMSAMPEATPLDEALVESLLKDTSMAMESDMSHAVEPVTPIAEQPAYHIDTDEKLMVNEMKPLDVRAEPQPALPNDQATLSSNVEEMKPVMVVEHAMPVMDSPQPVIELDKTVPPSPEVIPAIIEDPVVSHVLKADSEMPAEDAAPMEHMPMNLQEPTDEKPTMVTQMHEMTKADELASIPELIKGNEPVVEPAKDITKLDETTKLAIDLPSPTVAENSEVVTPIETHEHLNSLEELKLPEEDPKPETNAVNHELSLDQEENADKSLESLLAELESLNNESESVLKHEPESQTPEPTKIDSDVLKHYSTPELTSTEIHENKPVMHSDEQLNASPEKTAENPEMSANSENNMPDKKLPEAEENSKAPELPATEMNSEEQKSEIIKTISSLINQATMDSSIQPTLPVEPTLQSDEMLSGSPPQIEQVAHEPPMILVDAPAPLADLEDLMNTPALLDDHKKMENPLEIPVQVIFGDEPVSLPTSKDNLDSHLDHSSPSVNTPVQVAVSDPIMVENPTPEDVLVKGFETPVTEKEVTHLLLETGPVEMKDAVGEFEPIDLKFDVLPQIEDLPSLTNFEDTSANKFETLPEYIADTSFASTINSKPSSIFEQVVDLASNLVKAETLSASAEEQPVVHDLTVDSSSSSSAKVDEDNDSATNTFSKSTPTHDGLGAVHMAHDGVSKESNPIPLVAATSEPIEEIDAKNDLVSNLLRIVAAEKIGEMVERTDLTDGTANRIDMARSLHGKKIDPRKRRFLFKSSTNSR